MPDEGLVDVPAGLVEMEPGLYSTVGLSETSIPGLYEIPVNLLTAIPFGDLSRPRVQVTVSAVPEDAAITLFRLFGKYQTTVRGALRESASGAFVVVDYEVPLGIPVTYRAELYDVSGESLGITNEATVTIAWPGDQVVISDPLAPASSIAVDGHSDFGGVLTRKRPYEQHNVSGRIITLMGLAGKLEGIPLVCNTRTIEAADELDGILDATLVLVRSAPPSRLPPLFYAVVGTVKQVPQDVQWGGEWVRWDIEGDETDSSPLDVQVPIITYQMYNDAFPTYGDFNAAYLTYLDALRNPPGGV